MKKQTKKQMMKDQQGFVTSEFVFAMTMAAGVGMALFVLTYTLTIVEVAQYIAFATARAQSAGHIDADTQKNNGLNKYKQLMADKVFKNIFISKNDNAWFVLSKVPEIKSGSSESDVFSDYTTSTNRVPNTGVRIKFTSKILDIKLPLLGRLLDEDEDGFTSNITAFQFREPSMKECQQQVGQRFEAIKNLDGRFNTYISSVGVSSRADIPMEDNGC